MISSRTPEGDPTRCPVCGNDTRVEPSTVPVRDAPCPHCGHLLWFSGRHPARDERAKVNRLALAAESPSPNILLYLRGYGDPGGSRPAGAVWLRTKHGNLQLEGQENLARVAENWPEATRRTHEELLRQVARKGQPVIGWPRSTVCEEQGRIAANESDYVLLISPIVVDKEVVGLVEVWQDAHRGNDAQRGFLQFMVRMTGHASHYAHRMAASGS